MAITRHKSSRHDNKDNKGQSGVQGTQLNQALPEVRNWKNVFDLVCVDRAVIDRSRLLDQMCQNGCVAGFMQCFWDLMADFTLTCSPLCLIMSQVYL